MLLAYVDDLIASGKNFRGPCEIYEQMIHGWLTRESRSETEYAALAKFSDQLAWNLFLNSEHRGEKPSLTTSFDRLQVILG